MENKSSKFDLHANKARNGSMLRIGHTTHPIKDKIVNRMLQEENNTSLVTPLTQEQAIELRTHNYLVEFLDDIEEYKVSW